MRDNFHSKIQYSRSKLYQKEHEKYILPLLEAFYFFKIKQKKLRFINPLSYRDICVLSIRVVTDKFGDLLKE